MSMFIDRNKLFITTGIITLSLTFLSCGEKKKDAGQAGKPTPVNVQPVELQPAVYYDQYPGTVVALSQVELRAEVGGYITGISFKEGDHVQVEASDMGTATTIKQLLSPRSGE